MPEYNDILKSVANHPRLIILSGPSAVGKDAVIQELKRRDLPLFYVVTMTSRPPRPGEKDGVDYLFTTSDNFESRIKAGEFVEWAKVYGQYKGILRSQITNAFESGRDALVRVDVQGSRTLRRLYPDAILIFLVADNEQEWLRRLRDRKTDTQEQIELRVRTAQEELAALTEFDYLVVNITNQLKETADQIQEIISAEHHRIKKPIPQDNA